MKREHVYIAVAIFLALFLVVVSFDNSTNFTGRVIDENATNQTSDNQTTTTNQTETTNQTTETNQTSDNQTTTTNQTETTNQTTETNQTDTTSQSDTTTQDDSSQTTATTSTTTTTTTDEEESDVQVLVNQTEPQESEVDRILRELEEQGILEGSQPEQPVEQQEQQSEEEAPTLTGSAIEESNETTCDGCLLKEECYAFNERKKGDYCLENKSWSPQIAFNEICAENFECRSNSCVGGQCTQVNILQLLIDWVRELFNIGSSGSSNITNFSN